MKHGGPFALDRYRPSGRVTRATFARNARNTSDGVVPPISVYKRM
jgi:hypothetical protein